LDDRNTTDNTGADHHRLAETADIVIVFKLHINIWHRQSEAGVRVKAYKV